MTDALIQKSAPNDEDMKKNRSILKTRNVG